MQNATGFMLISRHHHHIIAWACPSMLCCNVGMMWSKRICKHIYTTKQW